MDEHKKSHIKLLTTNDDPRLIKLQIPKKFIPNLHTNHHQNRAFNKSKERVTFYRSNSSINVSFIHKSPEKSKMFKIQPKHPSSNIFIAKKNTIEASLNDSILNGSPKHNEEVNNVAINFALMSSCQSPVFEVNNKKEWMKSYESELREVKMEFIKFKESVSRQLIKQTQVMMSYVSEVCKILHTHKLQPATLPSFQSMPSQIAMDEIKFSALISSKISQIPSLPDSEPLDNLFVLGQQIANLQGSSDCQKVNFQAQSHQSPFKTNQYQFQSNLSNSSKIQLPINQNDSKFHETLKFSPPDLQAKKIEKDVIENYKSTMLAITKSNQNLFFNKKGEVAISKNASEIKNISNNKLEKFYRTMEKLKSEINEIKLISEEKQTNKSSDNS